MTVLQKLGAAAVAVFMTILAALGLSAWWRERKRRIEVGGLATDQAAELGELKGQEQADRVTDAGAAALERVKEADAKTDKEVQDAVAKPGGLVGYLRGLGRR